MSKIMKSSLSLVLAVGLSAVGSRAATYSVDTSHTTIGFSVRHMMVSNVRGNFGEFSGTIEFDEANPSALTANAEIQVKSVNTDNQKRDDHLRSPDFFDAETNPTIKFETTKVEGSLPNLTLVGNLTIKGTTKEISLPVELAGPIANPWGQTVIGLSGSTTINRQDYGLTWSKALDGGGVVVGDEVKISIELEAIKQ